MSSTPISSTYPYLPPTTNVLDPQQRARLIRSTRKLGAVLGTAPYLLENDVPVAVLPLGKVKNHTSQALRHQGSIFTHRHGSSSATSLNSASSTSLHDPSPSASLVSLPQNIASGMQSTESFSIIPPGLSTSYNSGNKPRPLYLHLKPTSVTPADSRFALSPHPPTPSRASAPSLPPSPHSPDFSSKPDIGKIRRKQMAKLTRHLGENIPAELVLGSSPRPVTSVPSPDRIAKGPGLSVGHGIQDAPFAHDSKPSVSQTRQDWVGEWNRSDIRDVREALRGLRAR